MVWFDTFCPYLGSTTSSRRQCQLQLHIRGVRQRFRGTIRRVLAGWVFSCCVAMIACMTSKMINHAIQGTYKGFDLKVTCSKLFWLLSSSLLTAYFSEILAQIEAKFYRKLHTHHISDLFLILAKYSTFHKLSFSQQQLLSVWFSRNSKQMESPKFMDTTWSATDWLARSRNNGLTDSTLATWCRIESVAWHQLSAWFIPPPPQSPNCSYSFGRWRIRHGFSVKEPSVPQKWCSTWFCIIYPFFDIHDHKICNNKTLIYSSTSFVPGNRLLHNLTFSRNYSLRVDLEDFENNTAFALYDVFVVNSEADGFRLTVGGYSGTAGWCFSSTERTNKLRLKYLTPLNFAYCIFRYIRGRNPFCN